MGGSGFKEPPFCFDVPAGVKEGRAWKELTRNGYQRKPFGAAADR